MKQKLFCMDSKGKMRVWSIEARSDGYETSSGLIDGSKVSTDYPVPCGLASRTQQQQIRLEMTSKIRKKHDAGYIFDLEKAKNRRPVNSLGYLKPMLAKKYRRMSDRAKSKIDWGMVFHQRKYNGHRCLITKIDGKLVAYSRGGKPINNINFILKRMTLPDGITIDGELYVHGLSLQKISSLIKRKQEATKSLRFICYDVIINEPYHVRLEVLKNTLGLNLGKRAMIAPTAMTQGELKPEIIAKMYIEEGFEGSIMRIDNMPYEDGKRSNSLIAVKLTDDGEFKVIDIIESKEHLARLVCICKNGKTFKVFAPGNKKKKRKTFVNRKKYIGKKVHVEFPEFTDKGIPSQPVAIRWRNDPDE